jgi:ubiquitin-protein ligase
MMPILGKDWRPVLSINTVLLGLQVNSSVCVR